MAISVARDTSLYFCRVVLFCLFLALKMLVLLGFFFTLLKFPLTGRGPGGMWYWWSLSIMTKSTADFAVKLRYNKGKVDDSFRLPIFQYVCYNGDHWCCRDMHQWKYSLIRRGTMRHLFLAQNDGKLKLSEIHVYCTIHWWCAKSERKKHTYLKRILTSSFFFRFFSMSPILIKRTWYPWNYSSWPCMSSQNGVVVDVNKLRLLKSNSDIWS